MYRLVLERPRFKTFTEEGKRHFFTIDVNTPRYWTRPDGLTVQIWHWYAEWWFDKLASVASTCGTTTRDLWRLLASQDATRRAIGYQMLIGEFGPDEFDCYPVKLTETEAQARYADIPRDIPRYAKRADMPKTTKTTKSRPVSVATNARHS